MNIKKFTMIAYMGCMISILVSCSDERLLASIRIKNGEKLWKNLLIENGDTINLIPYYEENMPNIDSVEYIWDKRHIETLKEMPFCSKMFIEEDSLGVHILHNIIFYHNSTKIDYIILYTVK